MKEIANEQESGVMLLTARELPPAEPETHYKWCWEDCGCDTCENHYCDDR